MRFLFLAIFISSVSHAQRVITVDEAIATALQNNYDIQISRNDSMVAAIDYSFRNAAFLPRVNATVGNVWNTNSQKQEFSDGTNRERNGVKSSNLAGNLGVSWVVFDGLKMFITRDKLEQFISLGEMGVRNQISLTVADVINNYYNIVRQKQQLRAVEEQMSVYEERVKLAEAKFEIGTGIKPDVLQGRVDLNAQKAAQMQQLTLIEQLKVQLNRLMNIPLNSKYDVVDTIPLQLELSLGNIQAIADTLNPALKLAEQNIAIAQLTLKERRAERWPTVSINGAYNYSRTNNNAVVNPFSPLFSRNKGFNYGISASIPILNNLNTRRLIKQAQLDIQYRELIYMNERSRVNMEVINAFSDYEFQKRALRLEEENITLARENVMIAMERYRLGVATFIEMREAQRSLEDAFNRLITARYNTKVAETALLRLQGDF